MTLADGGATVSFSPTMTINAGDKVTVVLSDIRMLRDFGVVTLIDLSVSLIGVLLALPAALVVAERSQPLRLRHGLSDGVARTFGSLGSSRVRAGSGNEPA